jgi:two-component system NtrC family sensor kinase
MAHLQSELRAAHERQTATADILEVINSSRGNLTPVFDAILRKAHALCGIASGSLEVYDGERFLAVAVHGLSDTFADVLRAGYVAADSPATLPLLAGRRISHIHDTLKVEFPVVRAAAELEGIRTVLLVPLRKEGRLLGMIAAARHEVKPFSEKEIGLLENFAVQAAIAIENARLFNETQEALERQTATADILKVIASSPSDVQPVFDAIASSSKRLLSGFSATVFRFIDGVVNLAAYTPVNPAADEILKTSFPRPAANLPFFELAKGGEVVQEPDSETNPDPGMRALSRARGFRSSLFAPLMNRDTPIGLIVVTRKEPGLFAPHHVQLLQTFADQAVIAIENARLFNETQEALERQTATADILKVIASSPSNVQPVFEAIAERSNRLINGLSAAVYSIVGDTMHLMAFTRISPEADATLQATFPRPVSEVPWALQIRSGDIVEIPDAEAEWAEWPDVLKMVRMRGFRSMLFVPLLRDGTSIGVIGVSRKEPGRFAPHHVQLLQTFADQAVIAIGNVQLFDEVQARTRELAASLDDLRTAQDRLIQTEKLASLGQLTAGIAHEIKNPLNFVNNFSSLSAELTDELNDLLKPAPLDDKMRQDVDELTGLIKNNLEKVVQHGKRADSIVKNMLLHSREGSGEQRPTDINALLDESLNLAYHGARAEKPSFNITLQRAFDEGAGSIEAYPQEITRAFLNLISNGFYAATKRGADNGEASFEPLLSATTKNLGGHVEIRIRDNGTGIPPEVREKMFNPFFTTKPAGEGTGLGLSMSHDIIVKQHGGRIDVATAPGQFTEFTIVLPRTIRR